MPSAPPRWFRVRVGPAKLYAATAGRVASLRYLPAGRILFPSPATTQWASVAERPVALPPEAKRSATCANLSGEHGRCASPGYYARSRAELREIGAAVRTTCGIGRTRRHCRQHGGRNRDDARSISTGARWNGAPCSMQGRRDSRRRRKASAWITIKTGAVRSTRPAESRGVITPNAPVR
jgi:hypothetical protein